MSDRQLDGCSIHPTVFVQKMFTAGVSFRFRVGTFQFPVKMGTDSAPDPTLLFSFKNVDAFSRQSFKIKSFNLGPGRSWSRFLFSTETRIPTVTTRKAHSTNFFLYINKFFSRHASERYLDTTRPPFAKKRRLPSPPFRCPQFA